MVHPLIYSFAYFFHLFILFTSRNLAVPGWVPYSEGLEMNVEIEGREGIDVTWGRGPLWQIALSHLILITGSQVDSAPFHG